MASAPYRTGKNYFLKYIIEVEGMKAEVEKRNFSGNNKKQNNQKNQIVPEGEQEIGAAIDNIINEQKPLGKIYVEMIVVLLIKAFELEKSGIFLPSGLPGSFLIIDILDSYRPWLGKLEKPIIKYPELISVMEKLEKESIDFKQKRFIKEVYLHRLINYTLEVLSSRVGVSEKKKKKIHTHSRVERLVFIWKKVKENQKISLIDLSNMISKELEENMPFKVDKKTIVNLVKDLETLGVAALNKYKIMIESQKIVDLITTFNRGIVTDTFVDLTEEMIADDPCIKNPTFKRNNQLPVSLQFLLKDPTEFQSPEVLADKKYNTLESRLEKIISKEAVNGEERGEIERSKALFKFIKSAENRLCKEALLMMKVNRGVDIASEVCANFYQSSSATERSLLMQARIPNAYVMMKEIFFDNNQEEKKSILNGKKSQSVRHDTLKTESLALKTYLDSSHQTIIKLEKERAKEFLENYNNEKENSNSRANMSFEEMQEIAENSEKNTELYLKKLIHILKRNTCIKEQELVEKFKIPSLASKLVRLLILQGDIEEMNYFDKGASYSYLTLNSK